MLRRMVAFDIIAYCENNDEIVNMVTENLLETLERIKTVCGSAGNEFELQYEARQRLKPSKTANTTETKLMWSFVATENTLRSIENCFDDAEELNLVTYYLDIMV